MVGVSYCLKVPETTYLNSLSHEESRDMKVRKDGRYTVIYSCRCAALAAKPHIEDKTHFFFKLVCFLQLPACNVGVKPQTLFVTTGQPQYDAEQYAAVVLPVFSLLLWCIT